MFCFLSVAENVLHSPVNKYACCCPNIGSFLHWQRPPFKFAGCMAEFHELHVSLRLVQRKAACDSQTVWLPEMAVQSLGDWRCSTRAAGGLCVTTRSSGIRAASQYSMLEPSTWHAGSWVTNEAPRSRNWYVLKQRVSCK